MSLQTYSSLKSQMYSGLRKSWIPSPRLLILHCWLDRSLTGCFIFMLPSYHSCFYFCIRSSSGFDKQHRKVQSSCIQTALHTTSIMSITHFSSSREQTLHVCQGKSSLKASYHRFTAPEHREQVKKIRPPDSCVKLGLCDWWHLHFTGGRRENTEMSSPWGNVNTDHKTHLVPSHWLGPEQGACQLNRKSFLVVLWFVLRHSEQHCSCIGCCQKEEWC